MKFKLLAVAPLLGSALSFAQNATDSSQYFSSYYPLISDPYVSGAITLIRDITIIVVLWMFFYKYFGDDKKK